MHRTSLVLACALVACAKADTSADRPADTAAPVAATAAPNTVTIVAKDFAYDAPDTIPAGMTTLRLVNQGPGMHHITLVQLHEGKTFADLQAVMKTMRPTDPPPAWMSFEGGPQPPAPGDTTAVTQQLEPGNYALLCFVDVPDHVPHFAKGMAKGLIVAPSTAAAAAPSADVTVGMVDYSWTITPELKAGEHVIKVENSAQQAHEFLFVKLADGKTAEDLGRWAKDFKGPPPGVPMGGIAAIRPGATSYVHATLPAGNYVMICFLPDAKDGKPHVEHGMIRPFTVS